MYSQCAWQRGDQCVTLDQYASNQGLYDRDSNITLSLEPGNHYLMESSLSYHRDLTSFEMVASQDSETVINMHNTRYVWCRETDYNG